MFNQSWLNQPIEKCSNVLDIGAGGLRRADHVKTVDILELPNTDYVFHVEKNIPWPFEDNEFDYIILSNVIEHIDDLEPFLKEINRVCKPGGIIRGTTPHFTNPCAYADPTHKHYFSLHFLDCFSEKRPNPFLLLKKILGCDIVLGEQINTYFKINKNFLMFREILWPTLIPVWAHLFQDFYEVHLSRLLPAWSIFFELENVKGDSKT